MKRLFLAAAVLIMHYSVFAGPREAQWQSVEDAIQKGLPKTAITNLEPIIQGALKDKAFAEAVRAIGKRIALESNIQGNKPEEKITRLEAEIAKAPKEMAPVLDTLLAHWYWHYFQQNKWRFMNRTATAAPPGKDFTTWDLPRLFAEIDRQFQKALGAEAILKATPVAAWKDLLEAGTMPDSYRPTLYDFIAHEALDFYCSGEQAGAKAENAFELSAESPILDSVEKFLAWKAPAPGALGEDSPVLKAIRLYQDLLRFHQSDPAPSLALADADLDRLSWGWNAAFGESKNARYKTALEVFIRAYGDFDISALACEREARVFQQEDDLVAAHQLAQRGAEAFPTSPGGRLCRNLVNDLEAKSIRLTTERVWNRVGASGTAEADKEDVPTVTIHYQNLEKVYFRAIASNWESFLQKRHHRPNNLDQQERRELLAQKAAFEWSEALPQTSDYRERTFSAPAPSNLRPGFYFIAASPDPSFKEKENVVSLTDVWVSDLALVLRPRAGLIEGFALEANTGEPLAGAAIAIWHLDNQGNRVADPPQNADENGFFSLKPSANRGYLFRIRHQGRELASDQDLAVFDWQRQQQPRPTAQTVFFTDRALYRPGQMIQYKGICLWVDQTKDDYQVLKGEPLTVVFRDTNGKEIARQKHRANDYGSFAGSFTAPRDRAMGAMSLLVDGRAQGQTVVRVEEYKRPKFEVTLDAPKTAAKLNEVVRLTGHAMSYTGAAIDGAGVRYRVVRQVRWPVWWGWWRGRGPTGESQEIAHGTIRTDTDGSFNIEFVARPDPAALEKDEPTFNYEVHADVTDTAGETRSAERGVRVGYTALQASVTLAEWQVENSPVELKLETQTLDGEPQVAEGSVKVYSLKAPARVQRAPLPDYPRPRRGLWPRSAGSPSADENNAEDLSNPRDWPVDQVVVEQGFTTGTNGLASLTVKVGAGAYRVMVETRDRFGKKVTARAPLTVLQPAATKLSLRIPHLLAAPTWEVQPGQEFLALWGTGYEAGRAFVEIEHQHQMLQRFWTKPGETQQQLKLMITEAMRGGFTLHVTQVRANRGYLDSRHIEVPWLNKELELKWEHFVSKLQPGQKETWTVAIGGQKSAARKAEKLVAEMVAALYDESLDAFDRHDWVHRFDVFREDHSSARALFSNAAMHFRQVTGGWSQAYEGVVISYRSFPADLTANLWGYGFLRGRARAVQFGAAAPGKLGMVMDAVPMAAAAVSDAAPAPSRMLPKSAAVGRPMANSDSLATEALNGPGGGSAAEPRAAKPDLSQVTARKNLNETAFFFPQLTSDSNGIVRMTFTMPEALTKWRFLGFAHDRSVRSGFLESHAVTAKDLMVQPNPPRFLREGDTVEFTVKISNQSDRPLAGTVRLTFDDALQSGRGVDAALDNAKPEQPFNIPAKESRSLAWRIHVPDGCGFLTYKAVAATTGVSDGEEGALPVLSRRILVTESLPLPIRGPGTKQFEFTKLLKSGSSKTLRHQSLTAQMVSQPAWYAVLALPYLMEYPHECSEQIFNRLYANALARTIANRDPKIRRVFDQWKNTPALDSPLEKNQDLKAVALEETPWLRQAQNESQARRNVGILFDENRLNNETEATLEKLSEMQLGNGAWPWFPGGPANDYITLYITTGFGRLRQLGADVDAAPALRSLQRLDGWMTEAYQRIQQRPDPEQYVPSSIDALYLYGRSFFLKDQPIASPHQPAVEFYLKQARKFWLQTNCRQTQAQLALALQRFRAAGGLPDATPAAIMKSLKERSVSNEEMGMFWRDTELSWWWYRAPIETQALMIEAFDEVAHDAQAVEDCRVWLLKQKQTQDWKTTKATADAVYALLLRGQDLLSSGALVELRLNGLDLTPKLGPTQTPQTEARKKSASAKAPAPSQPEAGTGFYEVRFAGSEIKPKLGEITVKKVDAGVSWGSVHWQYLEDMARVTPHEGTPLKLKKALFTKANTSRGPVLEAVKGPVKVGDELVVRVELRTDRDMEYVHLKDQRGSGTEPVSVLSQYKYQDGLAYYESTRDTASHFFIDYLPKGTYVFEYSTRVQLRGQYQTGIAEIQCMYAPELNSHSESLGLIVK